MFKKLLKTRVPLSWVFFAVAAAFAVFRYDLVACWIAACGVVIALIDTSGSKNIVD